MPADSHANLTHIYRWIQEVDEQIHEKPNTHVKPSCGMKLRSTTIKPLYDRRVLEEVTGNRKRRKLLEEPSDLGVDHLNKRSKAMEGRPPAKKPRGRPPKIPAPQLAAMSLDQHPHPQLAQPSQDNSRTPSPTKSGSSAGRKKGVRYMDQPKSDAAITMQDLGSCDPPVFRTSMTHARRFGHIPPGVHSLYVTLTKVPSGFIPPDFKKAYHEETDTPRRSREPPLDHEYMDAEANPFAPAMLQRLRQTVDRLRQDAEENDDIGAHEGQWGSLVSTLLFECILWHEDITSLNVEYCTIEPVEFRPMLPTGERIRLDDNTSISTGNGTGTGVGTSTGIGGSVISRMVDWCLALKLSFNEKVTISQAFSTVLAGQRSLNQSLSYIHKHPIFLDIELKKQFAARDPEVQLAIWASAGMLKRKEHGWDTSLPMPGITVYGHTWTCYLFFPQGSQLTMLGPLPMGNTSTLGGIWQVVHQLYALVQWGRTDYRAWFEREVMGWAIDCTKDEE